MNELRFGIAVNFFGPKVSVEQSLRYLAKAGVTDVEIPVTCLVKDVTKPVSLNAIRKRLNEVRRIADDSGIMIWQMHSCYGACDLVAETERQRQENIDIHKKLLDCALMLGAPAVIIHIGGRNDFCSTKDIAFIRDKNVDSLARMVKHIGDENTSLALENLLSRFVEAPEAFSIFGNRISDLREVVAGVGSEKIGICLDTGHANIESLDVSAAVREADRQLIATHIQENNGVYDMHMLPFNLTPAFSHIDWFAVFRAFKEIDYPYPLIGECTNNAGEYPLWLAQKYLKSQKQLIDEALEKASRSG